MIYVFMRDRTQTLGLPPVADWKNDHGAPSAGGPGQPKTTWQMQLSILASSAEFVGRSTGENLRTVRQPLDNTYVPREAKSTTRIFFP